MPTAEVDSSTPNHLPVHHEAPSVSGLLHQYPQPPIHRLPPEVLCKVFLPSAGYYRDLFRARTVCKYWAEVIDSTPELWTSVSNWLHPKLQAMIIWNSGNQLLEVGYDAEYWVGDQKKEDRIAEFAWLMKATASRWHNLTYHQWGDHGSWPLSRPLHNLKRIKIDGLALVYPRPTLDAPKILYVDISFGSVNLRYLSGLQVLTLHSTDCTLDELTTVLRASPGLKELSLKQMSLYIETEGLPNSYMNTIRLYQLHNLHISGALAESGSFLLDRIDAPRLEILDAFVIFPSDAATQTQLCEAAGRHLGAFPLPENQKAQVVIKIRTWAVECGIGQRRITICNPLTWNGVVGRQAMFASLASVTRQLGSSTCEEVTSLKISCEYDEECGECLRIIHLHFPRIDQILVEDELEGTRGTQAVPVIQHLSVPSQLGLTEEWLFPNLAKLRLFLLDSTSTNVGRRIVELVERRKEAEQTVKITELRIEVGFGDINLKALEILRQSVTQFELVLIGGPA